MNRTSGLTVRQHERSGIQVPVEFLLCAEHTTQVRFSPNANALDHHAIAGMALDISPGGLGLQSRHFLPRMCEGLVRVSLGGEIIFEQRAKVRRVVLCGREPQYMIGLAFVNPPDDIESRTAEVLRRFEHNRPALATPKLAEARHA